MSPFFVHVYDYFPRSGMDNKREENRKMLKHDKKKIMVYINISRAHVYKLEAGHEKQTSLFIYYLEKQTVMIANKLTPLVPH